MARTLWCRNEGCGVGYASVAGDVPAICPACEQPAHWTVEEPPSHPWRLTHNDRRLLRALRIAADDPEREPC